ncbi:MAG TPA: lipocalin family protein [Phycisphaerae bacterium]|nr:lipocalin family protein [Phycisphaerae bacterium]HRW54800.1 lipocalin family protein [Phycisphaerae bacterium]
MKTLRRLTLTGLALMMTGCSLEGKWSLSDVEPTAARRDFEFESLTLQEDGTFYAEARGATGIETSSGTYIYDDDTLTLTAHSGEQHAYNARFVTATRLELQGFWNGQKVYAKFNRVEKTVEG